MPTSQLRFNVGFIVHEEIGYSHDFTLEFPRLDLPPDLSVEQFRGSARFSRTPQGLLLDATLSASLPAECGRCLDELIQSISTTFTELYAFDPRSQTDSGLLVPESGIIDLAPLAREYLLLAVPINALCRPDCAGLCPVCGENRNHVDCGHAAQSPVNPGLAQLNDLLNDEE